MGAIPFNSIQFTRSPGCRRGAHQFLVNLGWPFILLSCPQNGGHVPRPAQLEYCNSWLGGDGFRAGG